MGDESRILRHSGDEIWRAAHQLQWLDWVHDEFFPYLEITTEELKAMWAEEKRCERLLEDVGLSRDALEGFLCEGR